MSELIERAKEKMKQQADQAKHPLSKMLSMQIMENITSIARAEKVLDETKTLDGCQSELDKLADSRKAGNKSFVGPDEAKLVIFKYFEFDDANPVEVSKVTPLVDVNSFI